jgi:hypothetical protein
MVKRRFWVIVAEDFSKAREDEDEERGRKLIDSTHSLTNEPSIPSDMESFLSHPKAKRLKK